MRQKVVDAAYHRLKTIRSDDDVFIVWSDDRLRRMEEALGLVLSMKYAPIKWYDFKDYILRLIGDDLSVYGTIE